MFPLQNFETRIFLAYFASNKKNEKFQICFRKPMDYPLWKISNFWTFLTSCFYCLNRRFSSLEYRETPYSGLFCLE